MDKEIRQNGCKTWILTESPWQNILSYMSLPQHIIVNKFFKK